ncbi:MAG: hypothetical protein EZS28_033180 [Streblomastix strix]|uniref:Uncharacterized protein n=1 Tax=Streblomastix strix TaxID=222440 RepID=A0A5J4ULX9_9EUKA|nr:MAG: hypothetical protein EZS28_033180 [Streblomastix strix]
MILPQSSQYHPRTSSFIPKSCNYPEMRKVDQRKKKLDEKENQKQKENQQEKDYIDEYQNEDEEEQPFIIKKTSIDGVLMITPNPQYFNKRIVKDGIEIQEKEQTNKKVEENTKEEDQNINEKRSEFGLLTTKKTSGRTSPVIRQSPSRAFIDPSTTFSAISTSQSFTPQKPIKATNMTVSSMLQTQTRKGVSNQNTGNISQEKIKQNIMVGVDPVISSLGLIRQRGNSVGENVEWEAFSGDKIKTHVIWRLVVKFRGNAMERGIGIMSGRDLPYPPFDKIQDRIAWYRGINGNIHVRGTEFQGGEPWGGGDTIALERPCVVNIPRTIRFFV